MLYGYRYRKYLQSRENAQLALWILSPHIKEIPTIDDLVGVWDNGEVVSVKEKYYRDKNRALRYKHTHNI